MLTQSIESAAMMILVEEFEQFLRLPENQDHLFELIDGTIVEKVLTEEQGVIVLNIGAVLGAFIKEQKLGRIGTQIRYRVPGDLQNSRMPDLAYSGGYRPAVTVGASFHLPDLAIEVKSPATTIKSMRKKASYYLANGIKMVWLVYPHKRFVEIYSLDVETEILFGSDVLTGGNVLPGFSMPVVEVFADVE